MFDLNKILRDNIRNIKPYSSARDEYTGKEGVFLDANENPIGSVSGDYNRYPDPLQKALKARIGEIKGVETSHIFLGNGSDEPIDLLIRAVCNPGEDNVVILPPTYGMYRVSADINDVAVKEVPLTKQYDIDVNAVLRAVDENTKIIFLCSPNNPTGNSLSSENILYLIRKFNGLVVLDEAYIDFVPNKSFMRVLPRYPNLVILQTFSKAWGWAALRLGMAFASEEIIDVLNKIKPPYNINEATQRIALEGLKQVGKKEEMVETILAERKNLRGALNMLRCVEQVFPSDANFLLVKVAEPRKMYNYLVSKQLIVRDRSTVALCEGCLRITVGTRAENGALITAMKNYSF